jgi:hypothetical protein
MPPQTSHRRTFLGFATSTALLVGSAKASAAEPGGRHAGFTPEKVNMRHAVLIGAPAGQVYAAITSQEGLSAWWTPDVRVRAERENIARIPFGPNYSRR